MVEVKVPIEAQLQLLFLGFIPLWKRCIYNKLSWQNKQKQGLSLQGDQQVKKPMNQVTQISKHLDK